MLKYLLVCFSLFCIFYVSQISSQNPLVLSQECLGCICHASSICNTTAGCSGEVCGPFKMTWAYWADGGKPTINQQNPDEPGAYGACANDPYCGALAVQGYMQKFQQDCNLDGKINCDDFIAIHKLGGYGCQGQTLPDWYNQRYAQCKQYAGGEFGAPQ